jgi:hypothetical protein
MEVVKSWIKKQGQRLTTAQCERFCKMTVEARLRGSLPAHGHELMQGTRCLIASLSVEGFCNKVVLLAHKLTGCFLARQSFCVSCSQLPTLFLYLSF